MTPYKAPLRDMYFHLNTSSDDEMSLILDQAAKFCENVLAPANEPGDTEGCRYEEGKVYLPTATKSAFEEYVANGWMGINMPEQYGGQALPYVLGSKISEMITSTNHAISMVPALTMSACKALIAFGNEDLKNLYLPKMITGEWTGTMCMTEPHCGSDLGLINTSATPVSDRQYKISGTKIFISAGEHDGSNNIIHLVLARIKGAKPGTKGLSLFLVPKILPDTNLQNSVSCIGIEEKMGIHANPTCSMSFEDATGYLVGKPNEGMKAMFTMMNEMRLGTALQGVGLSEHSFQKSYHYATERKQGKTLDKNLKNDATADQLIMHADVRRMLLIQKSFAEGGRALCHYCADLLDSTEELESNQENAALLGLLTPIAKAFLTEAGLEASNLAIQVFGGHGYIKETGAEQLYRDGRIATLYEGTTGIQALDLLGRKILGDQGKALLSFTKKIHTLCKAIEDSKSLPPNIKNLAERLTPMSKEWPQLSQEVGMKALQNHEEVSAAAYDFLMYSGYICLGYFWLNMAANTSQNQDKLGLDFAESKAKTAAFYFDRLLPRANSHKVSLQTGKDSLSSHTPNQWIMS